MSTHVEAQTSAPRLGQTGGSGARPPLRGLWQRISPALPAGARPRGRTPGLRLAAGLATGSAWARLPLAVPGTCVAQRSWSGSGYGGRYAAAWAGCGALSRSRYDSSAAASLRRDSDSACSHVPSGWKLRSCFATVSSGVSPPTTRLVPAARCTTNDYAHCIRSTSYSKDWRWKMLFNVAAPIDR